MKEYLSSLVKQSASTLTGKNLMREYLQARILASLQKCGAMMSMAFHGGTALRLLYSHGRYSEDLDFTLERKPENYNFRSYLQAIQSDFKAEGYQIEVKINDKKTVNSAFIRFPELLFEMGLSSMRNEIMAVKIEVDTNPPPGAQLETTVVRRFVVLQLQHPDNASMLAGKLHAILQRPFTKGRDLYDLLWYISDPSWPAPNFKLLNNALLQSDWDGETVTNENWKDIVLGKLTSLDWNNVIEDVRPFVEPGFDLKLLSKENFENILGS